MKEYYIHLYNEWVRTSQTISWVNKVPDSLISGFGYAFGIIKRLNIAIVLCPFLNKELEVQTVFTVFKNVLVNNLCLQSYL